MYTCFGTRTATTCCLHCLHCTPLCISGTGDSVGQTSCQCTCTYMALSVLYRHQSWHRPAMGPLACGTSTAALLGTGKTPSPVCGWHGVHDTELVCIRYRWPSSGCVCFSFWSNFPHFLYFLCGQCHNGPVKGHTYVHSSLHSIEPFTIIATSLVLVRLWYEYSHSLGTLLYVLRL